MSQAVHVEKSAIQNATLVSSDPKPLAAGAARLQIESFSVTANNVTYAVVGDGFGYWNFFPTPDAAGSKVGIVPMWGHAKVIEDNDSGLTVGERVYGYLPMASHLDVVPGKISAGGFVDIVEHRQSMSPIYNQYSRLAADPEHDPAREGERMIFGPLFKTGFLIEYFMRNEDWFGAKNVILTSASSKTALGLASVAKQTSPDVKRIGLTSAGNIDFVKQTGLYDQVLSYDAVDTLEAAASVSVDFAGNAKLLASIHAQLGDKLRYSCLVGATHIEERGTGGLSGAGDMAGPKPILFFAPDHAVAMFKELGPEEASKRVAQSWHKFLSDVGDTVIIERHQGLDAARDQFTTMAGGTIDPSAGIVIEP